MREKKKEKKGRRKETWQKKKLVFLFKYPPPSSFRIYLLFFFGPQVGAGESDNGNRERLKQATGMYQESIKPKKKEKVESRRRRRTMQEKGLEEAWTSRGMKK